MNKISGSSGPGASQAQAWLVVGLLWFVALLNYLDRLIITTMRESIMGSISMTDAQFGLLTATFLWIYGGFSPVGGFLADRYGRSKVIIVSLLTWSLITWLTGHAQNYQQLLVTRALMGISEACYIPAAFALISDYHRGPTRSLATGIHSSGIYAGAALGGIGGFIASAWGWRAGFNLFGIIGVIYALVLIFFLRDVRPSFESIAEKRKDLTPSVLVRSLFSSPVFWILLVISILIGMANWVVNGWLPTYLRDQYQLSVGAAGVSATAYIQAASFAGVLMGGFLADRWSRRNARARELLPAIALCVAGPVLFFTVSAAFLVWAIIGFVVYGLARGFFDSNLMPIVRETIGERTSATAYGMLNFVGCAAGGAMIYLGGLIKDAQVSLGLVFQAAAVFLLIVGLLLFAIAACSRRSQERKEVGEVAEEVRS
jgi:MFS family permease